MSRHTPSPPGHSMTMPCIVIEWQCKAGSQPALSLCHVSQIQHFPTLSMHTLCKTSTLIYFLYYLPPSCHISVLQIYPVALVDAKCFLTMRIMWWATMKGLAATETKYTNFPIRADALLLELLYWRGNRRGCVFLESLHTRQGCTIWSPWYFVQLMVSSSVPPFQFMDLLYLQMWQEMQLQ